MPSVRDNIITIAEELFFEHGIANVRLQQIADGAGISVGHLAYHYKNKEAIVSAAYEQVFEYMSGMLDKPFNLSDLSDLSDFQKLFRAVYHLVEAYPFCFNNKWEIARYHSQIQKKWEEFFDEKLALTQKIIAFHAKNGNFKPELYKGAYKLLAQQIQLVFHFWVPYQILRNKPVTFKLLQENLWGLIIPHLSAKGIRSYQKIPSGKKSITPKTVLKKN